MTLEIYRVTEEFPKSETYGLTSQIRRSCSSIPANIAEGCGRNSSSDFARFLQIALGSASEVEYQLLLANELNMLEDSVYEDLSGEVTEIKRMLTGFIKKLRADG